MTLDPKVQRIIDWRESFVTLPDAHFFELIRMYLGEVKTPYNKQKLIEELGSFIRKDENKQNLVSLLNETDIQIISAVKFIPNATQEKLASFFKGTFSYAGLYEQVLNLEERLILYRHADKISTAVPIDVNPLLEETLEPYVSMSVLLEKPEFTERNESLPFTINPQFIASFISFALSHPDMCKGDGMFKKRALTELKEVYGEAEEASSISKRLQLLVTALCNLSLFHETDDGISVDNQRLALFAELPPSVQYVYLCVASCAHFGRNSLLLYAQLLLDTLAAVPREGYTRISLMRLAFLMREKGGVPEGEYVSNRFASLVAGGTASFSGIPSSNTGDSGIIDSLLDACVSFGILYETGKNASGEQVLAVSPLFTEQSAPLPGNPKILSIDAAFSVTVMPGLSLAQLLPLANFMNSIRYDTAAVFEINRHSVLRAFDVSITPEQIFSLLEKYSLYEIPQNLRISIEEWYHSYASVSLFKGYVLKVTAEAGALPVEKNPRIAPYIKQILAPGVYLLTITNDEEAKLLVQKSGLDSIGTIKTAQTESEASGLPVLHAASYKVATDEECVSVATEVQKKTQQKIIASLKQKLDALTLTAEQKEGLADRIDRRIVLNAAQLRGTSVRLEKLEAGGMDYNGKIHVVDSAITNNCMIEIECEDSEIPLVGTPLQLIKKTDNAIVRIQLEPDHTTRDISVGAAIRIKKMRGSIINLK